MKYTAVEGFSGAGGLSLGLKQAGLDLIFSFDNDKKCIETQSSNQKYLDHKTSHTDINEILNGKLLNNLRLKVGELFLLAGGPPCQGFSIQRIGSDNDDRNNLVIKFVELILELRPYYFIIENVPGISGKRGRAILEKATSITSSNGYWVNTESLDAQDFQVPQRRKRIFVVGERQDLGLSTFNFPEPTTPDGKRISVRDTISHLPPPPKNGIDHPKIPNHRKDRLSNLNLQRITALKQGQGREYLPKELLADCHRRNANDIGHRNVYGRMSWDNVAPTITARFDSFTRGMFGHPDQSRTISLHEGALLQTFPDDFKFVGNKVDIARQIGNAVPPRLAEILARQILSAHRAKVSPKKLA